MAPSLSPSLTRSKSPMSSFELEDFSTFVASKNFNQRNQQSEGKGPTLLQCSINLSFDDDDGNCHRRPTCKNSPDQLRPTIYSTVKLTSTTITVPSPSVTVTCRRATSPSPSSSNSSVKVNSIKTTGSASLQQLCSRNGGKAQCPFRVGSVTENPHTAVTGSSSSSSSASSDSVSIEFERLNPSSRSTVRCYCCCRGLDLPIKVIYQRVLCCFKVPQCRKPLWSSPSSRCFSSSWTSSPRSTAIHIRNSPGTLSRSY